MRGKKGNDDAERILNLGPKSTAWLRAVGLETRADVERVGSVMAFVMVKDAGFGASLNLLYALEAGLQNRHWMSLSEKEKAELRALVPPSSP